jgi:hypothetical protein
VNSSNPAPQERYDGPLPPSDGELFIDHQEGLWKVARLTIAENPVGFYLVHLCYGPDLDSLSESMILGPREFAALVRDRNLRPLRPGPHLHSV